MTRIFLYSLSCMLLAVFAWWAGELRDAVVWLAAAVIIAALGGQKP